MITRQLSLHRRTLFIFSWAVFLAAISHAYHIKSERRGLLASLKPKSIFTIAIISTGIVLDIGCRHPEAVHAATYQSVKISAAAVKDMNDMPQSPGWELARQKRTAAMKGLQNKGIIKIDTDDSGNQYLKLPWAPDQIFKYKSLSISQRLQGEVAAGAIGELSKDVLLHAVDTAKTRKQALKKGAGPVSSENSTMSVVSVVSMLKDFYAGFPIVLASSIPQGGVFFLVKKGIIELLNKFAPTAPSVISTTIPIGFGVMAYWLFRTPTEVIKTQVQTYQSPSCKEALKSAKRSDRGVLSLWNHYNVMLTLDVPFQVLNFVLLGVVSDAVMHAGFETTILTRLFCGVTCGMVTAAVTCPIDVCKTRIISRDKKAALAAQAAIDVEGTVLGPMGTGALGSVGSEGMGGAGRGEEIGAIGTIGGQSNRNVMYSIDDGTRSREVSWGGGQLAVELDGGDRQSAGTLLLSLAQKEIGDRDRGMDRLEVTSSSDGDRNTSAAQLDSAGGAGAGGERRDGPPFKPATDNNVIDELFKIVREEGAGTLFLGIKQRLLYVGLANGIRLAAYGTSRMDLMMRSLDDL